MRGWRQLGTATPAVVWPPIAQHCTVFILQSEGVARRRVLPLPVTQPFMRMSSCALGLGALGRAGAPLRASLTAGCSKWLTRQPCQEVWRGGTAAFRAAACDRGDGQGVERKRTRKACQPAARTLALARGDTARGTQSADSATQHGARPAAPTEDLGPATWACTPPPPPAWPATAQRAGWAPRPPSRWPP